MIVKLTERDANVMHDIINRAARIYQGAIPEDCYHEPYMPLDELHTEMHHMTFFGWKENGRLLGVMGFQPIKDMTLIRHAYVLPESQGKGIGTRLVNHLRQITTTRRLLVGTWEDATWAVEFYQKRGFTLLPEKATLLMRYWDIPQRQIDTSVVLGIDLQQPQH
ncbi:MAG TPA: GNAT family N-acetyltransferase [Dehalococcoidia bacterium]|jgi:GNAT superfamily N-acetyltransferase